LNISKKTYPDFCFAWSATTILASDAPTAMPEANMPINAGVAVFRVKSVNATAKNTTAMAMCLPMVFTKFSFLK
jgi:hypothetical protein